MLMSGNFSIGDELSEFVQDAASNLQYDKLKKTWPIYFGIGALVFTTSIMALAKGCEREHREDVSVPNAVQNNVNLLNKDSRILYALNFRDLTESYTLIKKKGDYDYYGLQ